MLRVHALVTVKAPLVVRAEPALLKVPPQLTVLREVNGVVKVTVPLTVSGADHEATGLHVGVPAPPPILREALVKRPVVTGALPEGAISTVAVNEVPLTAPVDTAPVLVASVRVPDAPKTVSASVIAAMPVFTVHAPFEVKVDDVVRAKPELVRLAPLEQRTVDREVRAVAKVTAPFTMSGPAKLATGVHVTPPPRLRIAEFVNKPVLTADEIVGAITTVGLNAPPLTAPVLTAPEEVISDRVPAAEKVAPASEMAAVPVLIVQVPETVEEPVTVKAKAVLVIDAPVIVSEPIDTAASRVTPAMLVTVSGTPSVVVGVQLIAPVPASASDTLPVPAPVLTDAAEVGAIDTVPAADPLSAPVEMAPPAVIRLRVTAALVAVLARVMAPDLTQQSRQMRSVNIEGRKNKRERGNKSA